MAGEKDRANQGLSEAHRARWLPQNAPVLNALDRYIRVIEQQIIERDRECLIAEVWD